MEVLLAMASQRYGVKPSTYARTRSYMDFWLDVRAMTQAWAWPLGVLTRAFTGSGGDDDAVGARADVDRPNRTSGRPMTRVPSWYRTSRGRRYNMHDLGPIKDEEKLPLGRKRTMSKEDMNASANSLFSAFSGRSRGSSLNAKQKAVEAKYAIS